MIESVNPFRPFFYKTKFDFSQLDITNQLEKIIHQYRDSELSEPGIDTTSHQIQPHSLEGFRPYINFVSNCIDQIWQESNFYNIPRFITSSHLNKITAGFSLREHAHPGVDIVVTGYIKKPGGSGNIEIRDPLEYQWMSLPINGHPSESWKEIKIEENDVVFFPGWLNHRTQQSQTALPRITLSSMIKTRLAQEI